MASQKVCSGRIENAILVHDERFKVNDCRGEDNRTVFNTEFVANKITSVSYFIFHSLRIAHGNR